MSEGVRRVAAILEGLARSGPQAGVRELAATVGASKSSVQRSLSAMVDGGLAARDPVTGHYRLGPLCLMLGLAYGEHLDLVRSARPAMADLCEVSGETVGLSVAIGEEMVHLAQEESAHQLRRTFDLGVALPLWAGAPGRVLLAAWTPEQARQIITARRPARIDPQAPPDSAQMIEQVEACRARGWAWAEEETIAGVNSVSAPVRGADGTVLAALTITGPSPRLDPARMEGLVPDLLAAAAAVRG